MRDDDSSAIPALEIQVDMPSPDRLQSLLRAAQARALESGPVPEPNLDEHLEWDAPPPELVQSLEGFKIVATIDQGGQGIVYKACHEETGRLIAVKVLRNGRLSSPGERRRFEREIQTLAKLKHPNIVKFIPLHNKSALKFFCMEFIEGEPIDEYVFQRRLSVQEVVDLVVKVCDAVQSAHRSMVLHRDLKPGNILVSSDGEPHILDFGLSRDLDAEMRGLQSRISNADQMVGTLVYSSPEQVDERFGDVDTRTDVYALGLLLYELLAGCKPYPVHGTAREVGQSITTTSPKNIRRLVAATKVDDRWTSGTVSDDLERILLKALEKEQSRRYESVEALKKDLVRYLRGEAVEARPASYLYLLRKFISRHRWGVGLTAALLIVILCSAVTIFVMGQRNIALARSAQNATMMNTLIKNGQSAGWATGIKDAIPFYESALDLAKSSDPNDPAVRSTTFEASQALASILFAQGDIERGLPILKTAEQIAEADYRARPNEIGALRQKALIHTCQTKRYMAEAVRFQTPRVESKYSEAWRLCRENATASVDLRRQIVLLSNGDDRQNLDLAKAISFQGGILFAHGRSDESLIRLAVASDIATNLIAKEPANVVYSLALAEIESNVAGAHIKYNTPGHERTALEWIEKSEKRLDDLQASRKALNYASNIQIIRNGNEGNKKVIAYNEKKREAAKGSANKASASSKPASPIP